MLLVIDCGNTNTVFAVYRGDEDEPLGAWRTSTVSTRTADEYAVWLTQLMALGGLDAKEISSIILATVVPASLFSLRTLCRKHFKIDPMVVGEPGVNLGIEVRIERPEEVGADRVVNAVAAHQLYGGPLIVVDFGTATTFDVVDEDGGYAGGIIAPGINLSLDALYMAAAQLPKIAIRPPERRPGDNDPVRVIGKNTRSAMHSGIFWGYVAMIEGLVARIKVEYGRPMRVVGTGGLSALFAEWTPALEIVDDDLTLAGLRIIHKQNAG
ncbi:type III pantothenate kinase [Thalassobaculum sp.]|uniref:type III pantothenate kinase n=1 Tax=Thalassobaculum sp. TaxID=2022740 RepID=UPI0032ED2648